MILQAEYPRGGGRTEYRWSWDPAQDQAKLTGPDGKTAIWSGGLLPAFELAAEGGTAYVKASATALEQIGEAQYRLTLDLAGHGSGTLLCEMPEYGVRFSRLEANWLTDTRLLSLQFGTRLLTPEELVRAPRIDRTFWPDWAAEGYCVPAAGSSPTHSFWRSWDMGDARLPLGSYGDAMGTPYAAAFPRPMYAAAMGGRHGWLAFGPGAVPDAPLTLRLQSATACLHYAYREDLWPAPDSRKREWAEPLRLAWSGTGFDALQKLYDSFGPLAPKSPHHLRSFLCTWGDFKEDRFDLRQYRERVADSLAADMVILDDLWESFDGSGEPSMERFPNFEEDLADLRAAGYDIALWQSIGWTDFPDASGLTADDLLCGPDGVPRQWRWSGNPIGAGSYHYLLDPSSERTQTMITERTKRIVSRYKPAALKLDFGYGFPSPDVCAPRDPKYRGERLAYELLKLICDAAKSVDPSITIIYYGIHPLLHDVSDLINLDDLGDAGDSAAHEIFGHNQRCLWAALAASHGMAVNTSTGYYWDTLGSILLDTAVVGVNGLTLGEFDNDGKRMTAADANRWTALRTWHRRSCGWRPLWLEANTGSLKGEPKLVSWGRTESLNGQDVVTSAALRNDSPEPKAYDGLPGVRFAGRWALLSQDDRSVQETGRLACVPFAAGTLALEGEFRAVRVYGSVKGSLTLLRSLSRADLPELRLTVSEEELAEIAGFVVER